MRAWVAAALGSIVVLAAACDRKPTQNAEMFDVCTLYSRDEQSVTKRCQSGLRCLLMLNDHAARCYRSCEKDADCAALGIDYRCEHANSHGPDRGCTRRTDAQ